MTYELLYYTMSKIRGQFVLINEIRKLYQYLLLVFYDTIILHEMIITLRSVPRRLTVKSL